jgi:hypothetical protein
MVASKVPPAATVAILLGGYVDAWAATPEPNMAAAAITILSANFFITRPSCGVLS